MDFIWISQSIKMQPCRSQRRHRLRGVSDFEDGQFLSRSGGPVKPLGPPRVQFDYVVINGETHIIRLPGTGHPFEEVDDLRSGGSPFEKSDML